MGIVDPAKVTRSALQNAASVAEMILTTEALVAEQKEEKPQCSAQAPQNPGMMYSENRDKIWRTGIGLFPLV